MIWWRRKRRPHMPLSLEEQRKLREARQARETAEQALEQTQRQGEEVNKVAGLLRQLRLENNFAALVNRSMQRRANP